MTESVSLTRLESLKYNKQTDIFSVYPAGCAYTVTKSSLNKHPLPATKAETASVTSVVIVIVMCRTEPVYYTFTPTDDWPLQCGR